MLFSQHGEVNVKGCKI